MKRIYSDFSHIWMLCICSCPERSLFKLVHNNNSLWSILSLLHRKSSMCRHEYSCSCDNNIVLTQSVVVGKIRTCLLQRKFFSPKWSRTLCVFILWFGNINMYLYLISFHDTEQYFIYQRCLSKVKCETPELHKVCKLLNYEPFPIRSGSRNFVLWWSRITLHQMHKGAPVWKRMLTYSQIKPLGRNINTLGPKRNDRRHFHIDCVE